MTTPDDAIKKLRLLLWRFVDAHQIPAVRANGEERLLLNVDPDLWNEAADTIGYDKYQEHYAKKAEKTFERGAELLPPDMRPGQ